MRASVRAMVRRRAQGRCEYCQLHETDADFLAFHVEHIVAKQHGGNDHPSNLCFACSECNWAKGTNLGGLLNGKLVRLFNPRRQAWNRHFRWKGAALVGKTRCGKATARVLNINDASRLLMRKNLINEGRFPPKIGC